MSENVPIRIAVLYAEVVGYVVALFKALQQSGKNIEIDVVYWDKKNINSSLFEIKKDGQINFFARSSLDDAGLLNLLHSRAPNIIYVSGWMDKGYLRAIRKYKKSGGIGDVVCGLDDQWKDKIRQHIGRIYFKLFYSKIYDFMWVSGKPQYHYAQRLGYKHERIITNLYSADTSLFNKKSNFSKRFVFVGRFDPVKALDQLVEAYFALPEDVQRKWPLVLIGDGQLKAKIQEKKSKNIVLKPFLQPEELMAELMQGGVACITSHSEQWGVAIHEMALLGFPFVLSSACGAATEFLISGYNGFLFRRSSPASLHDTLQKITKLGDEELELFSQRSHILGQRITSEHNAFSLLSVIHLAKL